jgi:hypothetical protein
MFSPSAEKFSFMFNASSWGQERFQEYVCPSSPRVESLCKCDYLAPHWRKVLKI